MIKKNKVIRSSCSLLKRQQKLLENHAALSSIQNEYWELLSASEHAIDVKSPIDLVRFYAQLVFAGITPSAKILIAVAEAFQDYIDAGGKKSLDDAFSLRPKKKAGHPLAQLAGGNKRQRILYYMWLLRREAHLSHKRLSIEKAAAKAKQDLNLTDKTENLVDTLTRDYIKKRTDKKLENLPRLDISAEIKQFNSPSALSTQSR